jgi:outer membrane receptor for ferrienterochelin and colicin
VTGDHVSNPGKTIGKVIDLQKILPTVNSVGFKNPYGGKNGRCINIRGITGGTILIMR